MKLTKKDVDDKHRRERLLAKQALSRMQENRYKWPTRGVYERYIVSGPERYWGTGGWKYTR